MNDVVRNYTWGNNSRRRRRNLRQRGLGCAKFLLPVAVVALLWSLWLARDNFDPNGFIPADSGVEIYINDIMDKRADILNSRVFALLPPSSEARQTVNMLADDLPVPEWLLNNLSAGLFHISAPAVNRMDALVVSTRMTRIGRLTERLMRFVPAVEQDYAGGLRLRHVPEAGIYYAARGRTLLVSMSRDSLIHALTLEEDTALDADKYSEGVHMATGADLFCRVDADAWPFDDMPFAQLDIALRIEQDAARVLVQGGLSPLFMERYAPFLSTLTPQRLPVPLDGIATISAATHIPLPALTAELAESFPAVAPVAAFFASPAPDTDAIEGDTEEPEDQALIADLPTLIQQALTGSGTTLRIAWHGVDPFEMFPVPLLTATFDGDTDHVLALFEQLAPDPGVVSGVDLAPRLDEEFMLAYAPFVGGYAIEPAVTIYGDGMLLSTSAALARELLASAPLTQTHPQEGNLYVGVAPYAAANAVLDVAREFAVSGLLRNYHTEAALEAAAQPWLDTAATIDDMVLLVSCDSGAVRAELKLTMHDAAPPQNPEPVSATPSE